MKYSSTTTDQHNVTWMTTRASYITDYNNDSDHYILGVQHIANIS